MLANAEYSGVHLPAAEEVCERMQALGCNAHHLVEPLFMKRFQPQLFNLVRVDINCRVVGSFLAQNNFLLGRDFLRQLVRGSRPHHVALDVLLALVDQSLLRH